VIYLFKEVWKYSGEDRWKVILFYILHSISFGGVLLKPYAFGRAINEIQINGTNDLRPTIMWMVVYIGGFFQFEIFHRIAQYFVVTTALRNQKRFIDDMYDRVCNLPMKWHMDHHSGEIVNRINVAGLALRDFNFAQWKYIEHLILSIGPILILSRISWQIALISLVLTIINLIVVEKMNKAIQIILHRKTENFHSYSARLIDFVSNIRTIISLGLGRQTGKELDKKFIGYYKENMNEFKINQPRCFVISFGLIATELIVISYYLWAHKMSRIPIMVGSLVMIVNYFRQMSDAFFQITSSFYETLRWKASLKSVKPILQGRKKQSISKYEEGAYNWKNLHIKDLSFKYSEGKTTLSDINLDIANNSKIAIVGLSGSGKSTLMSLLAGLYEPNKVKLIADNKEYSDLDLAAHTAILASQDSEIFENTILYNITFGLETNPYELKKVIDVAQLSEVLERLPKGLETDIRERGVNLSGGEKQRLSLARGLFFSKSKRLLLLDEVTSNVDALNERLIMEQILENYKDKGVICTIHRLHLLEMFDTVLVMNKGRVAQRGSFRELITTEGHLKKIWEKYLTSNIEFI